MNGFRIQFGRAEGTLSSFGLPQAVRNPVQNEMVFAFARPSFVVLAALLWTDRRRVEQDIL